MDAGLKGGYFLLRSNRLHFAPFVSVSGGFLESNLYDDPRDNKYEARVYNTVTFGAGIHTEVKLHEYSNSNIYGGINKGYLSLKLDAGYNKMSTMKTLAKGSGALYFSFAFLMGFGKFLSHYHSNYSFSDALKKISFFQCDFVSCYALGYL